MVRQGGQATQRQPARPASTNQYIPLDGLRQPGYTNLRHLTAERKTRGVTSWLTLTIDRPKLTPEDIKKLEAARSGPD
jgi:hypothetical protein